MLWICIKCSVLQIIIKRVQREKEKELIIKGLGMPVLNDQIEEGESIAETEKGQGSGKKTKTVMSHKSQERTASLSSGVSPEVKLAAGLPRQKQCSWLNMYKN